MSESYTGDLTSEDPTTGTTYLDTDGDGYDDAYSSVNEYGETVTSYDTDGDGVVDVTSIDYESDGVEDAAAAQNADGTYRVALDLDGDGETDLEGDVTPDAADAIVPIEDIAVPTDDGTETSVSDDQVYGDPEGDSALWFEQAGDGYCAPAAVAQIVAEYTGQDVMDESQFAEYASENGWLEIYADGTSSGMQVDHVLELLNDSGVPASLEYNTGIDDVATYLEDGRDVMVFVDSGELWGSEAVEDDQIDHALLITGIDAERGVVILSDTGDPNGNMVEYPIDQFMDAWADGNYGAIVCDESVADYQEENGLVASGAAGSSTAFDELTDGPWALLPVVLDSDLFTTGA